MTVLNAGLPLASILLGAGITYWLNVRTRKQAAVEDLFNSAIAAVALADVANNYVGHAPRWNGATDEDYQQFLDDLRRQGLTNAIQKIQQAAKHSRWSSRIGRTLAATWAILLTMSSSDTPLS